MKERKSDIRSVIHYIRTFPQLRKDDVNYVYNNALLKHNNYNENSVRFKKAVIKLLFEETFKGEFLDENLNEYLDKGYQPRIKNKSVGKEEPNTKKQQRLFSMMNKACETRNTKYLKFMEFMYDFKTNNDFIDSRIKIYIEKLLKFEGELNDTNLVIIRNEVIEEVMSMELGEDSDENWKGLINVLTFRINELNKGLKKLKLL